MDDFDPDNFALTHKPRYREITESEIRSRSTEILLMVASMEKFFADFEMELFATIKPEEHEPIFEHAAKLFESALFNDTIDDINRMFADNDYQPILMPNGKTIRATFANMIMIGNIYQEMVKYYKSHRTNPVEPLRERFLAGDYFGSLHGRFTKAIRAEIQRRGLDFDKELSEFMARFDLEPSYIKN